MKLWHDEGMLDTETSMHGSAMIGAGRSGYFDQPQRLREITLRTSSAEAFARVNT